MNIKRQVLKLGNTHAFPKNARQSLTMVQETLSYRSGKSRVKEINQDLLDQSLTKIN